MKFEEIDIIISNENISLEDLNDYFYQKIEKELVKLIKEKGITMANISRKSIYIDGRLTNVNPHDEKLVLSVTPNDENQPRLAGIRRLYLYMFDSIMVDICYIENNDNREVQEVSIKNIDKHNLFKLYKYIKDMFENN